MIGLELLNIFFAYSSIKLIFAFHSCRRIIFTAYTIFCDNKAQIPVLNKVLSVSKALKCIFGDVVSWFFSVVRYFCKFLKSRLVKDAKVKTVTTRN